MEIVKNNKTVHANLKLDLKTMQESKVVNRKQLRSCKADVITYENGYIALQSYRTVIAYITPDRKLYDVLCVVYGYTATSSQHIAKFRTEYICYYDEHFRIIW